MAVYVPERQVEYWTNVQIQVSLQSLGWRVQVYPITQRLEKLLGVDAVFACDRVKLFGLQHKALYRNGGDHWRLTPGHQQDILRGQDWTYYCCSDMRSMREAPAALHLARFYDPRSSTIPRGKLVAGDTPPFYSRWSAFLNQLSLCRQGVQISSQHDLGPRLGDDSEAAAIVDVIVLLGWNKDVGGWLPAAAAVFDRTLRPTDQDVAR